MFDRDTSFSSVFLLLALSFIATMVLFPATANANLKNDLMTILPKELYKPMKPDEAPDLYGPTPSNAQLGNQALSVHLRKTGTVSVFAQPRPSMYNQIKMHTASRDQDPRWGAADNAGQFFGLVVVDEYETTEEYCDGYAIGDWCSGSWKTKTTTEADTTITFLRNNDWTITEQTYQNDLNDLIRTSYSSTKYGLDVTVKDFIPINENVTAGEAGTPGSYTGYASDEALDGNALIRRVKIQGDNDPTVNDGKADKVKLFSYSNFNMTKNHHPYVPTSDWAEELTKMEDAYYENKGNGNDGDDAIYHFDQDRDKDERKNVIAMGFDQPSDKHTAQVGYDNIACADFTEFDCWANFIINGSLSLTKNNAKGAYTRFKNDTGIKDPIWTNHGDDCATSLWGFGWCPTVRNFFTSTGIQSELLDPSGGVTENVIIASGGELATPEQSLSDVKNLVEEARTLAKNNWTDAVNAKQDWYESLLNGAPLPDTTNDKITTLSKRALVTIIQNYDPRSGINSDHGGAIVASVARQSPYAEDWPRDGYYFNYILDHKLGLHDWVERRNKWYADLQQKPDKDYPNDFPNQPLVPAGNWAMNYYGNGVEGGIIPWEIDETGYMVEAFWDHYDATNDREYLREIYPALKRSADFLVQFKDQDNNLQKKAHEDDHLHKSQTMVGAQSTWMGLKAAEQAAEELGKLEDLRRYRARRKELGKAINEELWNEEHQAWGNAHWGIGEIAWPVQFEDYDSERMRKHLESSWEKIEPTFQTFENPSSAPEDLKNDQGVVTGLYEHKQMISLAKAGMKTSELKNGLDLIARKWATRGTNLLGEVWLRGDDNPFDSEYKNDNIVAVVSQPHAWQQSLFYLAAINTYSTTELGGYSYGGGYPGYPGYGF